MSARKTPTHVWVGVSCFNCGSQWLKRRDSLIGWAGRCRSCAQKVAVNTPIRKRQLSVNAREQVLRQGGVPNAFKFTKPGGVRPIDRHNNHRWRGGAHAKHTGFAYCDWRRKVYLRDGFTCQICESVGRKIHAHHIKSFAMFPALRYDVSNGVTLCVDCHKYVHKITKQI